MAAVKDEEKKLPGMKILVLGPGGPKGFAELGAISYLQSKGYLGNVEIVVGVSVGALIGLLYISGYKPLEIAMRTYRTNIFSDMQSINLEDLEKSFGLFSTKVIRKILETMIREKLGMIPTLRQLYLATGINLVIVTHNISKNKTVYLSYETDPDLSCIDAVLLSMNIPILFAKVTYNGDDYADGAIGDPYPIARYDNGKNNLIGIYPTSATDVSNSANWTSYVIGIIMSPQLEKYHTACEKASKAVINIKLEVQFTNEMWISDKNRLDLFSQGWIQTYKYFNQITLTGSQLHHLFESASQK